MNDLERIERDKATILTIIKYLLIITIIAVALYFGLKLFTILIPFAIGFILARTAIAISNQLYNLQLRLDRKLNLKRPLLSGTSSSRTPRRKWPEATGWAVFFFFLMVILTFVLITGVIMIAIGQIRSLAGYLPTLVRENNLIEQVIIALREFSLRLGGIVDPATLATLENELTAIQQQLIHSIPDIVTSILNGLASFVGSLPIIFFSIIVMIMSGFYFITDSASVISFLKRNVPHVAFRETTGRLINTLSTTLFRVIGGYLLLLLITFFAVLIGLSIIKMPYAVVFALIAAVVDFLPVLGISATMIPISLYMFLNSNIWGGLGALIIYVAITFLRRAIEPPILGNAMNLHPMATLFAMIVGIGIYGILGIILGPIILVIAKETLTLYGFDVKLRKIFGEFLSRVSE